MKNYVVAIVMAGLVAQGCKQGATQTAVPSSADEEDHEPVVEEVLTEDEQIDELIAEAPMPKAAEELFDDFLFNFASNRHLQMERIEFPLLVNSGTKTSTIGRDEWQMEHFFMHDEEYTLIFDNAEQMELVKDTAVDHVVVEKIFLEDEFIRQYLFQRQNGQWKLYEIRNQTLPRNPNASFIEFYHHFVTDSLFLYESLNEEIVFSGPDPEDDFSRMEGVITPDSWDAFAPDLPQRVLFNVVYGQQDSTSVEKIFVMRGIANGLEIEVTFRNENGHWKLKKLSE